MLVERSCASVVSFDIAPRPRGSWSHPNIEYVQGDLGNLEEVRMAIAGADCVFHVAAIVGPYHDKQVYHDVNYEGTLHVIEACRRAKVAKLVMSTSPSTRFSGHDIDGLTEAELPTIPMATYQAVYAETKALGELACRQACSDELLTVCVAPHQVYGPRDTLFVPNLLSAARSGLLRVFASQHTGYGKNRVSFTHVDNYCHGLICGERALFKGSAALGGFYIVTDGCTHPCPQGYALFWSAIDQLVEAVGLPSIFKKTKLPTWLLFPIAYLCDAIRAATGIKFRLNVFAVRMVTIHRWFRIGAAEQDLDYIPVISFETGWLDTAAWYKRRWEEEPKQPE
jgi:nucleoside-diphosphate-sugar epimerase